MNNKMNQITLPNNLGADIKKIHQSLGEKKFLPQKTMADHVFLHIGDGVYQCEDEWIVDHETMVDLTQNLYRGIRFFTLHDDDDDDKLRILYACSVWGHAMKNFPRLREIYDAQPIAYVFYFELKTSIHSESRRFFYDGNIERTLHISHLLPIVLPFFLWNTKQFHCFFHRHIHISHQTT